MGSSPCRFCCAPVWGVKPNTIGVAHPSCARENELRTQRDDALSLLRDLEYGSRHLTDGVLVPCCPDCDAENGQAHSEGCRVDGVLHRATGAG